MFSIAANIKYRSYSIELRRNRRRHSEGKVPLHYAFVIKVMVTFSLLKVSKIIPTETLLAMYFKRWLASLQIASKFKGPNSL